MILLLGASSYFGQAFAKELRARGEGFIPLSRGALDYARFEVLFQYVRTTKPHFVINADGIWSDRHEIGPEYSRTEILEANILLPRTIGKVCSLTNTPWGHLSSACIYKGAKVFRNGQWSTETDLNDAEIRRFFARHPESFVGLNEMDEPNVCFRSPPCSYQAGTNALAEEWLRERDGTYVWRAGIPFDEFDAPGNLLSKLQSETKVLDYFAPLSHLGDFVRGCLGLIERHASFGIYNVTNSGPITTRDIVRLIEQKLKPDRTFEFWKDDTEFDLNSNRTPPSGCILDSSKMARSGLSMRAVMSAVEHALLKWQPISEASHTERQIPPGDRTPNIVRLVQP